MPTLLSRGQVYELVWSTPRDRLCAQWLVSYPTLKKTCQKYDIPVPPRGHWAKLQAGKPVSAIRLPARSPGMSDQIVIGSRYWWDRSPSEEELLGPLPAPPTFPDDIAEIREQIRKKIGTVKVGRAITIRHSVTERLLGQDEVRREKQKTSPYTFSWHKPIFDDPFEQRRLRLLNVLFLALASCGGKPEVRGDDAREITVIVHQTAISLELDRPKSGKRGSSQGNNPKPGKSEPLRFAIVSRYEREQEQSAWQDGEEGPLERHLSEIAAEIVVAAEQSYRQGCVRNFEWRVKRKAELEEELRARQRERERQELERRAKLEQARIDRLVGEAASLRRAADIRAYVAAVKQAVDSDDLAPQAGVLARWENWALAQADRIDPVKNGKFLQGLEGDDASDE